MAPIEQSLQCVEAIRQLVVSGEWDKLPREYQQAALSELGNMTQQAVEVSKAAIARFGLQTPQSTVREESVPVFNQSPSVAAVNPNSVLAGIFPF